MNTLDVKIDRAALPLIVKMIQESREGAESLRQMAAIFDRLAAAGDKFVDAVDAACGSAALEEATVLKTSRE